MSRLTQIVAGLQASKCDISHLLTWMTEHAYVSMILSEARFLGC